MTTHNSTLLFLGTGGSMGVPVIGCTCSVCTSGSPLNKRLRSSALITINNKRILIDAGPDLRTQALKYGIDEIDGVILTHAHHDHTAGIDDLRAYNMTRQMPIPCLASQDTFDDLQLRYSYIFCPKTPKRGLVARFHNQILQQLRGTVSFLGLHLKYMTYEQAGMAVNGFCFGNLAFISDIRSYPPSIFEDLAGIEYLVISALRPDPSALHFGIDEAVAFSEQIGARHTWLTHIAHEVDHDAITEILPSNVHLAYDGELIHFNV